jgi:phospholipid/cholesterol/gamma-HCH transport system substrate-binding protein
VVELEIDRRYDQLPDDTSASIYTAGLLGEQYIGLEPGGSPDMLLDGSEIELTQSALIMEKLVSKFLFNQAAEGAPDGEAP